MANYLISLDSGTYSDSSSAEAAITGSGASITTTYPFALTYLIDASAEQLSSIAGVSESADADDEAAVTLLADNAHLDFLADHTGGTDANPAYTGNGKHVYLVDSGVGSTHSEFSGATLNNLWSAFTGSPDIAEYDDELGHGTAVASLIVGQTTGSAPGATLHNCKLFTIDQTTLTLGNIMDALSAILTHHNANTPSNAKVVCLPWIIASNTFVDNKIIEMDNNNLLIVCAAGNNGEDVNNYSPAGVDRVLTVGSFDRDLNVTTFTNTPWIGGASTGFINYGAELDCFALGVDVYVADRGDDNGFLSMTGTSLSAGITAGAAANWLEKHPTYTSNQIKDLILSEGHVEGSANLVFDESNSGIDYSSVWKAIVTVEQAGATSLTTRNSGRILNVQSGSTSNVDLGLNSGASNVSVIDFAPVPSWINVNTSSGVVTVNASGLDSNIVPGIFVFAMKGEVGGDVLIEEFNVGVYSSDVSELEADDTTSYYYDDSDDSYDPITNVGFQAATFKP